MRNLQKGKRWPGKFCGDAFDQLLVSMMRGGQIKGGLAHFDRQDKQEADKNPRQLQQKRFTRGHNVKYIKTMRCHIHSDGGYYQHGFVSHHLDQFPFSANVGGRTYCQQGPPGRKPRIQLQDLTKYY